MAPDDNPAAFVGTVLAFISLWWWPSPSLLLLFTALLLARIVNRSTGLTARPSDSVIVTALVIWTMVGLQNPFAGVAGALAFLLDARLAEPNQRQWVFASLCLVAVIVHVLLTGSDNLGATWLPEPHYMIAGVTLLAFLAYSLSLRTVSSHGDVGGLVLNIERVRGGMLVVWLLTLQTSPQAQDAMQIVVPLLAVMAGVVLAGTANRLGIPTGKPTGLHL